MYNIFKRGCFEDLLHHCFMLMLCFFNNLNCLLVLCRISANKSDIYRAIINKKLVYFWMVTDTNLKQLENSTETHKAFIGSIYCNVPAASRALITVKGKWCIKWWRLGPLDTQTLFHVTSTYRDMWKTRYTTSDVAVPPRALRVYFTGHGQFWWVTVVAYIGRITLGE
jgi:hypothetical protein